MLGVIVLDQVEGLRCGLGISSAEYEVIGLRLAQELLDYLEALQKASAGSWIYITSCAFGVRVPVCRTRPDDAPVATTVLAMADIPSYVSTSCNTLLHCASKEIYFTSKTRTEGMGRGEC